MKHALTIGVVTIAMLFLIAPTASATSWCSKGPDEQPDHPCDDDADAADAAAARFGAQWQSISGVIDVYSAYSDQGDYVELHVIVDPPSLAPSVEAVLPSEAGGFPVKVIAQSPEGFSNGDQNTCASRSQSSNDETQSDRFSQALADDETRSWVKLPGALALGEEFSECGGDPPKIVVYAQRAMV